MDKNIIKPEIHDFGCTCDDCSKDIEDDKNE